MTQVVQILQNLAQAKTEQVHAFLDKKHPVMALAVVFQGALGAAIVIVVLGFMKWLGWN